MWIWASSGRQRRTEEPGVLRSTGWWRGGHGLATEEQHRLLAQSLRPALWFWGLGFPSELICQWKKPATRSCRHQSLSPCCLSVCQGPLSAPKRHLHFFSCGSFHLQASSGLSSPSQISTSAFKMIILWSHWAHSNNPGQSPYCKVSSVTVWSSFCHLR